MFVGFYVDEGSTAPNMESAPEWSRLLQDCYDEKVDLIITQKASKYLEETLPNSLSVRASWQHSQSQWVFTSFRRIFIRWLPITRRIYTTRTFLPDPGWKILPDDEPRREMLHD